MREDSPGHLQGPVGKPLRTHGSSEKFIFEDRDPPFSLCSAPLRLCKVFILHGLTQSARVTGTEPGKGSPLLKPLDISFVIKPTVGDQTLDHNFEAAFYLSTLGRTKRTSAGT